MKNDFIEKLLVFFKRAEGFPEAVRDENGKIINWPREFQSEYIELLQQIGYCWTDDDHLEFAVWLELYENKKVPKGIIVGIARTYYDSPDKPSLQKIAEEVERERARRARN